MLERLSTLRAHLDTASSLDLVPAVLIAENDPGVRDVLRDALEMDRLKVLVASDGQEALALADAWMVDLLVTDVGMPRLDGFGLIRGVRRLYPGLPVIVTSGDAFYQGRHLAAAAAEVGVELTFLTPFDLDEVQRAIRTLVLLDTDADVTVHAGEGNRQARPARWPQ
jgi:CheY-like chemotaxis protein